MTPAVQLSTPPHLTPSDVCLTPLDVWSAIKTVLRRELGEREWEMWIQHTRLWRVMGGDTLGVLMPRKGRCCFGVYRHIKRVRKLAARMFYGVMVTAEIDQETRQLSRESIEAMDEDDPRKWQLLLKWETEQEWLSFPFIEPPCSPLWEGFKG